MFHNGSGKDFIESLSSCQSRRSTTRLTIPTRDLLEWPSVFG
jgi:hypothetical protein